MSNPARLHLDDPLDIDEARKAARTMSTLRREAEKQYEDHIEKAADAESAYRKGYAEAFIAAEGTAGEREAKAKKESASKARTRDIEAGLLRLQSERLRGLDGERGLLSSLIAWSRSMEERTA